MDVLELRSANDVALVGGKARSLGELINAGFDVPPGFVVSATVKELDKRSEQRLLASFDKLKSKYVAVRSSAAAEDGASDAWAGQLDTYLNVTRDDLINKVKLCQQSAQSARAIAYAVQKGLTSNGTAVIIQAMIQGEVSGIAFSANPVTGSKDRIIIEAGYGLNEPIVAGQITPDTYVVQKNNLGILDKNITNQGWQLALGKDGKNESVPLNNGGKQKLSDEQIKEVSKLAVQLETHFSFPVDCEWTYAGSKLFLLQCRPITTLV